MKLLKINLLFIATLLIMSCGEDSFITPSSFTADVDENTLANVSLGKVNVDTNVEDLTFGLTNLNLPGAISINGETGEIFVADPTIFDFETNTLIRANYTISGDEVEATGDITINIIDIDETVTPTFTIWSGPITSFNKVNGSDPTLEANQDFLTENVIITRGNSGGQIFNIASESQSAKATSPAGTEWAKGTTANLSSLSFGPFRDIGKPQENVGVPLVVHLIEDDIYIDLTFSAWSSGNENMGGFSYSRRTEN